MPLWHVVKAVLAPAYESGHGRIGYWAFRAAILVSGNRFIVSVELPRACIHTQIVRGRL